MLVVYKRNVFGLVKSLLYAVGGGLGVGVIAWVICSVLSLSEQTSFIIAIVLGVLVLVGMVLSAIFSENIAFEIYPDGKMRYLQKGKLKKEYNIAECQFGYKQVSGRNTATNITLDIGLPDGEVEHIDVSPLGTMKFFKMYEHLGGQK